MVGWPDGPAPSAPFHPVRPSLLAFHFKRFVFMRFAAVLAAALFLGGGVPASSPPDDPDPPFLLIHIDGISADLFQDEWEAGRLPALQAFFGDQGYIRSGVSMYPPFTSALILRIRDGLAMDEGTVIDWGVWDPDDEEFVGRMGVFRKYLSSMPRRSRSAILHGFPYTHHLAGISLWNLPEKVERYRWVEFYWFNTDTVGHIWGEASQRENLRLFDRYFGGMASNLGPEVQVLVYADHGMTFGEVMDYDGEVVRFLEGRAVFYAYPNIYLAPGEEPAEVAADLVRETWQEFAFFQVSDGVAGVDEADGVPGSAEVNRADPVDGAVEGVDPAGRRMRFEWVGGDPLHDHQPRVRYTWAGAAGGEVPEAHEGGCVGGDPLGYHELGYCGEALTLDEWLDLTHGHRFPYAPVRILELFRNPGVGDVVTVLNAGPKSGPWVREGNHHSLARSDMAIPVLVRGETLEPLRGRVHLPVEELGAYLPEAGFNGQEPSRDVHQVGAWNSSAEVAVSPLYRARFGAEVLGAWDAAEPRRRRGWVAWDVASGYVSRFWIGAGAVRDVHGTRALVRGDMEMRVRRVGARVGLSSDESTRLDLFVRAGRHLDLQLRNFGEFGVGFRY